MVPAPASRPLRVAFLTSPDAFEWFYGANLGLDREAYLHRYRNDFTWDYVAALAGEGVDVTLYHASFGPPALHTTPDGFRVRFLPLHPFWRLWRRFPVLSRPPLLMLPPWRFGLEVLNTLCFLEPLRGALAEDGADVLYVQEHWTGRLDLLAATLRIPIVAGDNGASEGIHFHVGKRRTFGRTAGIHCQTDREVARLGRYGVTARKIPNGVDTGFFAPAAVRSAERSVLVVARLNDHQKRVSDAIRALAQLPEPWRLDIVGTGPDQPRLEALVAEEGLRERVTFHGFVGGRAALRELYHRCGVFAAPSSSEGLPLAVLEAMSCGCAVVTSRIPVFGEMIDDGRNGLTFPVGRPDLVAEAIVRAYDERALFGARARERVERDYDRAANMRALAALMRQAAGTREAS